MPCDLFWALDSCISRVMAESDLRAIGVRQAVMSEEAVREHKRQLVLQLGEVYVIKRDRIVKAEPGALSKLRALM